MSHKEVLTEAENGEGHGEADYSFIYMELCMYKLITVGITRMCLMLLEEQFCDGNNQLQAEKANTFSTKN